MAPEHPPELVIFDARFEGPILKGDLHYVEVPVGQRLRVRWDGDDDSKIFQPVVGGVARVFKADRLQVLQANRNSVPDELGLLHYRWSEGLNAGIPWVMFILILPRGHTLVAAEPTPARAKVFQDRLALYWTLRADDLGRAEVIGTLRSFEGAAASKLVELNQLCSRETRPAHGSIQVESSSEVNATGLATWQKKLNFLQTEEAKVADPELKFAIQQRIEEAVAKIKELEIESQLSRETRLSVLKAGCDDQRPPADDESDVIVEFDRTSEFVGGMERVLTLAFQMNRHRKRSGARVPVRVAHQGLADLKIRLPELTGKIRRTDDQEAEFRHLFKVQDFLVDEAVPQLTRAIDLAVNNDKARKDTFLSVDARLRDCLTGLRNSVFRYGTPVYWGESTTPSWIAEWAERTCDWNLWWRDDPNIGCVLRVSDKESQWIHDKYRCDLFGTSVFPETVALDLYALTDDTFYRIALPLVLLELARKWPTSNGMPAGALDFRRWVFSPARPRDAWVLPPVGSVEFHKLRDSRSPNS